MLQKYPPQPHPDIQDDDRNKPVIYPSTAKRGEIASRPILSLPLLNRSELKGTLWRLFINIMG
jgi:hypothetical protein